MTARTVCTKAARVRTSANEATPRAISSMSGPAWRPSFPSAPASAPPARSSGVENSSGSTSSEPGSDAARSAMLTSRPRPPLSTSTIRSVRSGNW